MWPNCTHRSTSWALVNPEPPFSSASLGPNSFPPSLPGSFSPMGEDRDTAMKWEGERIREIGDWEVGSSVDRASSADISYQTGGWI